DGQRRGARGEMQKSTARKCHAVHPGEAADSFTPTLARYATPGDATTAWVAQDEAEPTKNMPLELRNLVVFLYSGLMSGGPAAGRDALQVIAELCGALGFTTLAVELLAPEQLPLAFQMLLVHTASMTSTLERHWRESICIELLSDDISLAQRSLFRFVVLRTQSSADLVEIAFIRIPLDAFAPALRPRFIEA